MTFDVAKFFEDFRTSSDARHARYVDTFDRFYGVPLEYGDGFYPVVEARDISEPGKGRGDAG